MDNEEFEMMLFLFLKKLQKKVVRTLQKSEGFG